MKNAIFIAILLLASWSWASEVGFQKGNERSSIIVEGDIVVVCDDPFQGGTQFGNFHCQRDILLPSEFDYFQGPEGVRADEVTLTAVREDKSTRSKTIDYDTAKMQSSKRFNLWIISLFQRPLLKMGRNQVTYVMKRKGKVTSSGQFEVNVNDGGVKACSRRGFYRSTVGSDCFGVGANKFCDQYFFENKYCLE